MSIQPKLNGYSNGTSAKASPVSTAVWNKLKQYLPSRDPDTDFWWKYSGLHLALMLEEAEYPPEKQMAALLFFYYWGVS
ncbi:hypothetical protein RRF57_009684 [Xylaria bambusicola]|uniref:Uncharacterized protein n=1 Tax=Xylaria bambusicola TaxID=326684 RepID=A0AAN7UK15_9PEZI